MRQRSLMLPGTVSAMGVAGIGAEY